MTDQDSPWKEVLEQEPRLALEFCFSFTQDELDWSRDHEVLEQELRAISPGGETGKRIADCLIKVHAIGSDDPRYLHLEIQGGREEAFARRMHVYNYRADDRFGQPVVSFAILLDDEVNWRPDLYESEVCRTRRVLEYSVFKVIDWRGREEELRKHANPMALFILAQLASLETKKDNEARAGAKLEVILLLQQRSERIRTGPVVSLPGLAAGLADRV